MNSQSRYYYLLGTIVAIGISVYLFIFPNFETAEFDPEVIENISKGVTTTVVVNENNEKINEESPISEDIDIEKENPARRRGEMLILSLHVLGWGVILQYPVYEMELSGYYGLWIFWNFLVCVSYVAGLCGLT